jgi:hypothetical protein
MHRRASPLWRNYTPRTIIVSEENEGERAGLSGSFDPRIPPGGAPGMVVAEDPNAAWFGVSS